MTCNFWVVPSFKIFSLTRVLFKAKRERKSKFNVREVLNLKEASPKVNIIVGDHLANIPSLHQPGFPFLFILTCR